MSTVVRVQIQQRVDTASNWQSSNPTLLAGEVGHESDTRKYKLGDGSTAYNSLSYAGVSLLDEDNFSSNSATAAASQQSVKAYVDASALSLIDEDNFATDSATRPPSQQSVKAYVDTANALKANLAGPTFTGTINGANLTLSGTLQVNGTTTTVATTNTTIADNLLELNSGATSNANDSGILIERGSTGDNAIIAWDESADKFVVGTTTGTADSTGDITITTGTLVANVEGTITATGSSTVSDFKGDVRSIPARSETSQATLVAADAGKMVSTTTGGWVVPASVFSAGDAISLVNKSGSDQTITCSAVTTYKTSDGSTVTSQTLGARGIATLWFESASVAYLQGTSLS